MLQSKFQRTCYDFEKDENYSISEYNHVLAFALCETVLHFLNTADTIDSPRTTAFFRRLSSILWDDVLNNYLLTGEESFSESLKAAEKEDDPLKIAKALLPSVIFNEISGDNI